MANGVDVSASGVMKVIAVRLALLNKGLVLVNKENDEVEWTTIPVVLGSLSTIEQTEAEVAAACVRAATPLLRPALLDVHLSVPRQPPKS